MNPISRATDADIGSASATNTAAPAGRTAAATDRSVRWRWQARLVIALLDRMDSGSIELQLPDGSKRLCGSGPLHAQLHVHDWDVFGAIVSAGDVGMGRTFIEGRWSTDDLAGLLLILARGRAAIERLIYGGRFSGLMLRLRHLLNANTRRGARRNIAAHYDLGNAFYALWLDPSMTYSAALFEGDLARSLEQAQHAKLARVLSSLGLHGGEHLLEIGCGWGAFAISAARAGAARVSGISLSREQTDWARSAVARAGVADRVDLQLRDYREVREHYDHIVSIEMIEAVGESHWVQYFAALRTSLRAGGRALIQAITIDDRHFEAYRRGTDFIQQYVFPGGMLPSPTRLRSVAEGEGLRIASVFSFGRDYAETLRRWRANFLRERAAVMALGFDLPFTRLWEFYLAYCEAGFDAGICDVSQISLRAD